MKDTFKKKNGRETKIPKKLKKILTVILILLIIAGLLLGTNALFPQIFPDWFNAVIPWSKTTATSGVIKTAQVTRGDVELTISGSGTVEPYERFEIIPEVNGEILTAPYNVGDYVEEGTVLYTFDNSDALRNIQKQENSLEKSNMTYNDYIDQREKLTVTAPASGTVSDMTVRTGDNVSANQTIATLTNTKYMKVRIPFTKTQLQHIAKGNAATISSSALMTEFHGTVTGIDDTPTGSATGSASYMVALEFENPGAITEGSELSASINGQISGGTGTAEPLSVTTVKAEIAGKVTSIYCENGSYVNSGSAVIRLSSDELDNSIKKSRLDISDAEQSLETEKNTLSDYSVTAPISGTVMSKNSKAGDTIDKTNSSVTMMVIADVSKLKFSLYIDELDIAKVSVGQEVKITADAIEDAEFTGYITEIAMEGEATNGVTTYSAEVTIYNPGELRPSMNVDAEIIIESAQDVLRVPTSDVKTFMGRSYVFVKETDGSVAKRAQSQNVSAGNMRPPSDIPHDDTAAPQNNGRSSDESNGENTKEQENGTEQRHRPQEDTDNAKADRSEAPSGSDAVKVPGTPDGYVAVFVETGVQGDTYTEIISGLEEGDEIYEELTTSTTSTQQQMPGGFGGMGMPGGGMPGGGMPGGGMPGGSNRSGGGGYGGNRSGGNMR